MCDGLLSKRSATFEVDADQFLCVKGDAAKLQAGLTVLSSQDRIFRPWISMKIVIRLIVAVGKTDAARVEEEKLANPADLLGVSMTTAQNTACDTSQEIFEIPPRARRAGSRHRMKWGSRESTIGQCHLQDGVVTVG